jgi:hypothetical protein
MWSTSSRVKIIASNILYQKKIFFSKKAKFIIFPSNGFWQKAAFAKRVNIDRSEKMKSMTEREKKNVVLIRVGLKYWCYVLMF